MSATDELLPCPICGRQPDFQHFNITPNVQGRIVCSCGIELRQGKNDTEDDIRIIWNTRSDYAVQAENERKTEQAIAAMLGLCNCTNGCTNSERTGTCTADETERFECLDSRYKSFDYNPYITVHVMECSECGGTYEHVNGGYEFCPRCGRKVVDE